MSKAEMCYIMSISLNIILLSIIGQELWNWVLVQRDKKRVRRSARRAYKELLYKELKDFLNIYYSILGD